MKEDSAQPDNPKKVKNFLTNFVINGSILFSLIAIHFGWLVSYTNVFNFVIILYSIVASVAVILLLILFLAVLFTSFYVKKANSDAVKDEIFCVMSDEDITDIKQRIAKVEEVDQLNVKSPLKIMGDTFSVFILYFAFVTGNMYLFTIELILLLGSRMIIAMTNDVRDELKKFATNKAKFDLRNNSNSE
jgi:hypothetical protein